MHSDIPVRLDPVDLALAQLLTNLTAASIIGVTHEEQALDLAAAIERHLSETAVLEQAKGRLSVQLGIDAATAFQCLRRYAARTGSPLRDVAVRVAGGTLRAQSFGAVGGAPRPPGPDALRCAIDPGLPGRLCLIGEADLNGEDSLRTALETVAGHGADVIVDLRSLSFLSAGAARLLAQTAVRLSPSRRLLLLQPTWSVARVLTMCGIDQLAGVSVLDGKASRTAGDVDRSAARPLPA